MQFSDGMVRGIKAYTSKEMEGRMLMGCWADDNIYLRHLDWDDAYRRNVTSDNHLDTFSLKDILTSAVCWNRNGNYREFNMEAESSADGAGPGESWRSSGFVISCE